MFVTWFNIITFWSTKWQLYILVVKDILFGIYCFLGVTRLAVISVWKWKFRRFIILLRRNHTIILKITNQKTFFATLNCRWLIPEREIYDFWRLVLKEACEVVTKMSFKLSFYDPLNNCPRGCSVWSLIFHSSL